MSMLYYLVMARSAETCLNEYYILRTESLGVIGGLFQYRLLVSLSSRILFSAVSLIERLATT
jgi:hypothetical protein